MVVDGAGRGAADDVPGADLRSPHHRRPRSGAVPGRGQGRARGSRAPAARDLTLSITITSMPNNDKPAAPGADSFDVIVIGGGPAGYPGRDPRRAERAARSPASTSGRTSDGSAAFGGTCLNAGCIPSKALLESSELYHRAHDGIRDPRHRRRQRVARLAQMQKRKAGIVKGMTTGILALFKAAGVTATAGPRQAAARTAGRVHGARRQQPRARGEARRARLGLDADRAALGCPSTASRSSTPGARSSSTRCRSVSA